MKRILLTIAIALALPALVICQDAGKNKKSGDEQAVRQVLNDLATALGKNDLTALDRIYADDYTFVGDTGAFMNKADRLAAFKAGDLKYESITIEPLRIRMFGDTAVAITDIRTKLAPGGKYSDGKFITVATFMRLKGRWQLVVASNIRPAQ